MSSPTARAQRIQDRAERAVAYWIDRLADDGISFVGSEDEARFEPLSAKLAALLEQAVLPGADDSELDKAELLVDRIEAFGMGTEGMRIRARAAHEDMMIRRDEEDVPVALFLATYETLMTQLHAIDAGVDDLGASLLQARKLLLEIEDVALRG